MMTSSSRPARICRARRLAPVRAFPAHLLAAAVIGATALLAQDVHKPTEMKEMFLTAAVKEELEVNGSKVERWVPTDRKIAFAWSDQPFAIHIPYVAEKAVEGGQIFGDRDYRLNLNWRGFGAAENRTDEAGHAPAVLAAGFHRLDGQPVRPDSKDRFYIDRDRLLRPPNLDLVRLARQGRPPASIRRVSLPAPAPLAYWLVVDPRNGLPSGAWKKEGAVAQIEASVEEEGYPATRTAKKLEVRIRQNGWRLGDAKVRWTGSLDQHVVAMGDARYRFQNAGDQFKDGTLAASHRFAEVPTSDKRQPVPFNAQVSVAFPPVLLDQEAAAGKVEMRVLTPGDPPTESRYGIASFGGVTITAYRYQSNTVRQAAPDVFGGRPSQTFNTWNTSEAYGKSLDKATGQRWESLNFELKNIGAGTLPHGWAGAERAGSHRLFAVEIKYYDGSDSASRVVRHADVYASRLSELENNEAGVIGQEAEVVQKAEPTADDGYFDWLVRMNEQREQTEERMQEIMLLLQALRGGIELRRAQFLQLLQLDLKAFPPDNDPNRDIGDVLIAAAQRYATGGRYIQLRPTLTQAALAELKETRDRLQQEISGLRAQQGELIREGTRITKQLVETADVQTIGSRDVRENLRQVQAAVDYFKDQHDLARLNLYDAAGWHDSGELQKAIEDMKFASQASRELAKVMEAKAALADARQHDIKLAVALASPNPVAPGSVAETEGQRARIAAMNALREVLEIAPGSAEGERMLREIELELLDWIPAKLEREKKVTMAAFRRFLGARGYYEEDPKNLWEGFKEYWSVAWGTSPISLGANASNSPTYNTAAALADAVSADQIAIAKNQVSLLAIRRLVRNGVPLRSIPRLRPEELAERMVFHTVQRTPLDPKKAHRICQDIHETFAELADLRALASGNADEFVRFIGRNYYDTFKSDKGWSEGLGDVFLSPFGLLMFLGPSAVVRVDGAFQYVAPTTEAALAAQGAKVERVRDVFATALRLEQFGEKLARYPVGEALIQAVVTDQRYLAGLSTVDTFLTKGSRLGAAIVIYCGLAHLADESNVPGLRLLVDAIGALGAEEAAYDVLFRRGAPLNRLLTKLDDFGVALAREKAELLQLGEWVEKLEAIRQRLAAEARRRFTLPNKAEFEAIEKISEAVRRRTFKSLSPGAGVKDDAKKTIVVVAESLKKGDHAGAARGLGAVNQLKAGMEKKMGAYTIALQKARQTLQRQPALRQISSPERLQAIDDVPVPKPILPTEGMPTGVPGRYVKYGDEAVMRGKLDEALDLYRKAAHEARRTGQAEAERFIEHRLVRMAEAQAEAETLAILRSAGRANTHAADAIEPGEFASIVSQIDGGKLVLRQREGGINALYDVVDADGHKTAYLFKQLPDEGEAAVEVFAAEAARRLGIKVPGVQHLKANVTVERALRDVNLRAAGGVVREQAAGILIRVVEGETLRASTEAGLLALKGEYARQRVLRAWLGDSDGHLGNMLKGLDGNLWAIDFGMGSLKADGVMRQIPADTGRSQEELVAMVYKFSDYVSTSAPDEAGRGLYHWMHQADNVVGYDEMAATVQQVKDLCEENGGRTLRRMLERALPASEVDEAFGALVRRSKVLEETLKKRFPAIKTAGIFDSPFRFDRQREFRVVFEPRMPLPLAA